MDESIQKYGRIIYWSEEDKRFIVEVSELKGCIADVATVEEAIKNSDAVIQMWLDTAKDLGRNIPNTTGRFFLDLIR